MQEDPSKLSVHFRGALAIVHCAQLVFLSWRFADRNQSSTSSRSSCRFLADVRVPCWHSLRRSSWSSPTNKFAQPWRRRWRNPLLAHCVSRMTVIRLLLLKSIHQKYSVLTRGIILLDEAMIKSKMRWHSLFSSPQFWWKASDIVMVPHAFSWATPRCQHGHSPSMTRQKARVQRSSQFWWFTLTRCQIYMKSASCAQCTKNTEKEGRVS
jgi:hypothetical protein